MNGPPAAALQPTASLASTVAGGGAPAGAGAGAGAPGGTGAAGQEVVAPAESREFVEGMRRTIDSFTVKMRSLMARGRPLASDTSIQTLFQSLLQLHPRLLELVKRNEELRGALSTLCPRACVFSCTRILYCSFSEIFVCYESYDIACVYLITCLPDNS